MKTVEISTPSSIRVRNGRLEIKSEKGELLPLSNSEVDSLILATRSCVISTAAINFCVENNIRIIFCSKKFLPDSLILPLSGHSLSGAVVKSQLEYFFKNRAAIWQSIVAAKIRSQHALLRSLEIDAASNVANLETRVKSADRSNIEAQAAKIYWKALFGPEFIRNRKQAGINACLNYGYTVLRSCVARQLVSTGLLPQIGISHSNQTNSLPLVDDLIEPLRIFVDLLVFDLRGIIKDTSDPVAVKDIREQLIRTILFEVIFNGKAMSLETGIRRYVLAFRELIISDSPMNRLSMRIPELSGKNQNREGHVADCHV